MRAFTRGYPVCVSTRGRPSAVRGGGTETRIVFWSRGAGVIFTKPDGHPCQQISRTSKAGTAVAVLSLILIRGQIKAHLSGNGSAWTSGVGEVWSAHFHSWNADRHDSWTSLILIRVKRSQGVHNRAGRSEGG
jgi:hypothetical protein